MSAPALLHAFAPALTAASEAAEVAAAQAQVQLNPFGTLSTTLAWMVLVAVNGWCFQRILRHRPLDAAVRS